MGNRKFKLSEMIPNAWFFKLKEIGAKSHHRPVKKHSPPPPPQLEPAFSRRCPDFISHARKSYHFTRELNPKSPDLILLPPPDPPRKSSRKRRPTTKKRPSSSSSSSHGEETCVVIDVDKKSLGRKTEHSVSTLLRLPPIKTERSKFDDLAKLEAIDEPIKQKQSSLEKNESLSVKAPRKEKESMEQAIRPARRVPAGSPRFRIRVNSPRIARRPQANSSKESVSRRSTSSDCLAVVKSSFDPRRDFRDSMVEMIVENNIRTSKDLEELLACYLSLNSDEYHDVIIQVFKQIWFDLYDIRRRVGQLNQKP